MFDQNIDVTPVPDYSSLETRQSPNTPLPAKDRGLAIYQTVFRTLEKPSQTTWTRGVGVVTGEAGNLGQLSESVTQLSAQSNGVAKAATDRGILLARKYGSGIDREESSRLEILTARLRRIDPRVSSVEVDSLVEMVGRMEELSGELDSIRGKYAHL